MAKALVNSLAAEWQPDKYTDDYRDNLMRIIKAKSKGKTVTLEAAEEPRHAEVVDLMERLRQSLANRGSAGSVHPIDGDGHASAPVQEIHRVEVQKAERSVTHDPTAARLPLLPCRRRRSGRSRSLFATPKARSTDSSFFGRSRARCSRTAISFRRRAATA